MDATSRASSYDIEKQNFSVASIAHATNSPVATMVIKLLRNVQYSLTTLTLIYVAYAMDRNIVMPGVPTEEKLVAASAVSILLVILSHIIVPSSMRVVLVLDSITAILLFATFIFAAGQAAQGKGACQGPKNIGVWDNYRGCRRVISAMIVIGVDFA
ncbi:hypothetical protein WAI453_013707 [Rhynchosporium graminicola]